MSPDGETDSSTRATLIPLLLVLSSVLLTLGLALPVVRFDQVADAKSASILKGVWNLLTGGDPLLGTLILLFSVVFPWAKLVLLGLVWSRRIAGTDEKMRWLGILGKWSMLDVYVVVIFVAAVRLGLLVEVSSRPGLFVFAGGVLATMTTKVVVDRELGSRRPVSRGRRAPLWTPAARVVSLLALLTYVAGLTLPVMTVEKWLFWSSDYSVLSSLSKLAAEGELGLLVLLAVFVVLLPCAHLLALVVVRWYPDPPRRVLRAIEAAEEWAMADVFALALLVAAVQASGRANVDFHAGVGCIAAAAVLSMLDLFLFRRALQVSEG